MSTSELRSGTWLVTGAGGMLGRDLVDVLAGDRVPVAGLSRRELDVTDAATVREVVAAVRPAVVVNGAAWTKVDEAETAEAAAFQVNGEAVVHLAEACRAVGARLVQISTDYVFAGDATTPYPEDAPTGPRSAYGRSKLAGERAVLDLLPDTGYVARTAWLYGVHGPNLVTTMMRLERARDTVEVVDDQRGQPTWTRDLARQIILLMAARAPGGVYHATNAGDATWYELAREVFALLGADPSRVRPTTTDKFPRPAPRPGYSVLGHDRWAQVGLSPMRHWRDALHDAFPALLAQRAASPAT